MLASATATWVIVIVVVLCLATWLTAVALAARRPYWKNSTKRPMIGPVVGAIHYADGGRSVAPDREAPPVFTDEEEREIRRRKSGQPAGQQAHPRPQVPGQPLPGQPAAGQPAASQPAAGQPPASQPVPGQRSPATAAPATETHATAAPATATPAGSGADLPEDATGPGPDGAAGAGSGAERQPVYGPRLPGQREARQDQPEHQRPGSGDLSVGTVTIVTLPTDR